jgi:sugar phosphate isomerase/epimerase
MTHNVHTAILPNKDVHILCVHNTGGGYPRSDYMEWDQDAVVTNWEQRLIHTARRVDGEWIVTATPMPLDMEKPPPPPRSRQNPWK